MQSRLMRSRGTPLFGPALPRPSADHLPDLTAQLNERLMEKYENYARVAASLELRGEHDAAAVLRRAASRARLLRNGVRSA